MPFCHNIRRSFFSGVVSLAGYVTFSFRCSGFKTSGILLTIWLWSGFFPCIPDKHTQCHDRSAIFSGKCGMFFFGTTSSHLPWPFRPAGPGNTQLKCKQMACFYPVGFIQNLSPAILTGCIGSKKNQGLFGNDESWYWSQPGKIKSGFYSLL
jgi:hypothetical protein